MKPFEILIDLDRLKDIHTGLGQVAYFIGKDLSTRENDKFHFTFLVPKSFVGFFGTKVNYEPISFKRRYFSFLCKKYDLWYTIHQDCHIFPGDKNTPFIMTINDLNFLGEKSPKKAKKRLNILQRKVDRAIYLTAISGFTKKVVLDNLQVHNKPIEIVYCGVEVKTFDHVEKPSFANEGDLLFSIGVIQPKKNFMVLIEFMKYLPESFKLVIAGNKAGSYSVELENRIYELGLSDRIILPGLISEEEKYWMYQHCKAVLFPSKFEGMGFPPIEAMRFGKPVFASTFSSIPEVSGEHAYYWNDFDPKVMAEFFLKHLTEFTSQPGKPSTLINHSMKYTWQKAVDQYLHIFEKVLTP